MRGGRRSFSDRSRNREPLSAQSSVTRCARAVRVCSVLIQFDLAATSPFRASSSPAHALPRPPPSLMLEALSTDSTVKSAKIEPFDGSPIQAALFLRHIGQFASREGMLTLLLQNWFVSRNTIICCSNDICPLVKAHYQDPMDNPLPNDNQNPPNPVSPATRDSTYTLTTEDRKLYVCIGCNFSTVM